MSRLRPPWWLRLGAGLALLAGFLAYSDPAASLDALRGTRWWLAVPATAGLVLVNAIAAATWRALTRALTETDMSWGTALRTYYAAQALGSLTPGGVGADAYRVQALRGTTTRWTRAVLPVLVHRFLSYLSLLLLAAVAAWFLPVPGLVRLGFAVLAGGAILAVAAASLIPARLGYALPAGIGRPALQALATCACFHAASVAISYLLVVAVTPTDGVVVTIAALVVARCVAFLPFTPAGLGLQEGALALLLPRTGVGADATVAIAALVRAPLLGIIVVGGVALALPALRERAAARIPEGARR